MLNAAMLAGSTLVMVPRFDAATVLSTIANHQVTLMEASPPPTTTFSPIGISTRLISPA